MAVNNSAFPEVLAITTLDNEASGKLLEKIGFAFKETIETPEGETLRLFRAENVIVH